MSQTKEPASVEARNRALIADAAWCEMRAHYPAWSVDELLCHPKEAMAICKRVRVQFPRAPPITRSASHC